MPVRKLLATLMPTLFARRSSRSWLSVETRNAVLTLGRETTVSPTNSRKQPANSSHNFAAKRLLRCLTSAVTGSFNEQCLRHELYANILLICERAQGTIIIVNNYWWKRKWCAEKESSFAEMFYIGRCLHLYANKIKAFRARAHFHSRNSENDRTSPMIGERSDGSKILSIGYESNES